MMISTIFFPRIERRQNYKVSNKGTYYSSYSVYRQEIREDCLGRCVYCDCHENELGGAEHMNLDHLRPYERFKAAPEINHPTNLIWTCGACNRLKSDDWPTETIEYCYLEELGYLDPFEHDRGDYFCLGKDGKLEPLKSPATYMILTLELNRESRRLLRQKRLTSFDLVEAISKQIANLEAKRTRTNDEEELFSTLKLALMQAYSTLNFELLD